MRPARVTTAVAVLACATWLTAGLAATHGSSTTLEAKLGDRIRVADEPIGCQVVRAPELGGRIVLECRRSGALAGTYGTVLSAREAGVMRFKTRRTAKLLLVATHKGGVRQCR